MEKDDYVLSLRKSNYKITPQRLEVIDFIKNEQNTGHFTAEEVYRNVKEKEPTITLATVYNILRALRDSGSINSFEANGSTWFETNVDFHGNLICRDCGRIMDIHLDKELVNELLPVKKFSIDSANLVLRGLCSHCAEESLEEQGAML